MRTIGRRMTPAMSLVLSAVFIPAATGCAADARALDLAVETGDTGAPYEETASSPPGTAGTTGAVASSDAPGVPVARIAPTASRILFVTAEKFNGDLGGLAGADEKCQAAADSAAPLAGRSFRAWLSDRTSSVAARIAPGGRFVRVDGTTIAESWSDLIDGALEAPVSKTQKGAEPVAAEVWTATNEVGGLAELAGTMDCENWTDAGGRSGGGVGRSDRVDGRWTHSGAMTCSHRLSLFCVETENQ
jgi:hypothetical protein